MSIISHNFALIVEISSLDTETQTQKPLSLEKLILIESPLVRKAKFRFQLGLKTNLWSAKSLKKSKFDKEKHLAFLSNVIYKTKKKEQWKYVASCVNTVLAIVWKMSHKGNEGL